MEGRPGVTPWFRLGTPVGLKAGRDSGLWAREGSAPCSLRPRPQPPGRGPSPPQPQACNGPWLLQGQLPRRGVSVGPSEMRSWQIEVFALLFLEVGGHPLFQGVFQAQGIFATQGSSPGLRYCRHIL